MIDIVPNINTSLGSDSSDIKNKRSQISDYVKNTSWKMVFAKNQAEFDQLWEKMKKDVVGLGWNDVVAADTEKAKRSLKCVPKRRPASKLDDYESMRDGYVSIFISSSVFFLQSRNRKERS